MQLKFIGKDGSMGLKHGKVYRVRISSLPSDNVIGVYWSVRLGIEKFCLYSSPATLAKNWEVVKDGNEA